MLQTREEQDPSPGPDEVRIRVRFAGINFADLMARVGLYPDAPKLPTVVGYEVSGTVDALGANVKHLATGDRVFAMPKFGGYTDTLVLSARQAFKMPAGMSFEEGAALPVVYLTAHHMMLYTHNLKRGSTVLIHSAAGGVGTAAIQLAKTRGCRILGSASKGKHDYLRAQGCQHPIDSAGDFAAQVRALVGERAVDLILDPVGGRSFHDGYHLLAPGGQLVAFGLSAAASGEKRNLFKAALELWRTPRFSPMKLMDDNRGVSGTNMGHLFDRVEILAPQFEDLVAMYERGEVKPHVDKAFRFDDAAAAHHHLHSRKARGKVLLQP